MKFLSAVLIATLITPAFAEAPKRLVIIGDSITDGYGVSQSEAYPAVLQKKLEGKSWMVVAAGISGSTSSSAASRVKWQLTQKPDLVLLELGGNDGLRGIPVKTIQENLGAALALCKKASVKVILVGIKLPPNYGADYSRQFENVFHVLAKKYSVPLIPYLLENVGGDKNLNQGDGIHPNAKGHAIVAETIYQAIQKYL